MNEKENLPSTEVIESSSPRVAVKGKKINPLARIREKKELKKQAKAAKKNQVFYEGATKEEKVLKKNNFKFYKTIGVIAITLMSLFVIVCLVDIYRFVRDFFDTALLGNVVAGSVTGLVLCIIGILVIRPIVVALSTPTFTLDVVDVESQKEISRKNFRKLQKVAQNIIDTNDNVSQDSKNLLKTFINNRKELNATLKKIYDTEIAKDIQKTINASSTKALISTAISQNNKFDALSVILINVRMIMQICVKCGYHPTYARLSKLIVKVFRNAVIAYTIQSLNVENIIFNGVDKLCKGILSNIPGIREVTTGLMQGASNALLTMRIGIITRKYLYEEYNIQAMITDPDEVEAEIVNSAVTEANAGIDELVEDTKKNYLAKKGK